MEGELEGARQWACLEGIKKCLHICGYARTYNKKNHILSSDYTVHIIMFIRDRCTYVRTQTFFPGGIALPAP